MGFKALQKTGLLSEYEYKIGSQKTRYVRQRLDDKHRCYLRTVKVELTCAGFFYQFKLLSHDEIFTNYSLHLLHFDLGRLCFWAVAAILD